MFLLPESPRVGLQSSAGDDNRDSPPRVAVSPKILKPLPDMHHFEGAFTAATSELERLLELHRKPSLVGSLLEQHVDSILTSCSSKLSTASLVSLRRQLQALSGDVQGVMDHTNTVLSLASALRSQRDEALAALREIRSCHVEVTAALRAAETRELLTRDEVDTLRKAVQVNMIPNEFAAAQGRGDTMVLQPGARQHALQLARLSQYSFLPRTAGAQTPPKQRGGSVWEQQRRHKDWLAAMDGETPVEAVARLVQGAGTALRMAMDSLLEQVAQRLSALDGRLQRVEERVVAASVASALGVDALRVLSETCMEHEMCGLCRCSDVCLSFLPVLNRRHGTLAPSLPPTPLSQQPATSALTPGGHAHALARFHFAPLLQDSSSSASTSLASLALRGRAGHSSSQHSLHSLYAASRRPSRSPSMSSTTSRATNVAYSLPSGPTPPLTPGGVMLRARMQNLTHAAPTPTAATLGRQGSRPGSARSRAWAATPRNTQGSQGAPPSVASVGWSGSGGWVSEREGARVDPAARSMPLPLERIQSALTPSTALRGEGVAESASGVSIIGVPRTADVPRHAPPQTPARRLKATRAAASARAAGGAVLPAQQSTTRGTPAALSTVTLSLPVGSASQDGDGNGERSWGVRSRDAAGHMLTSGSDRLLSRVSGTAISATAMRPSTAAPTRRPTASPTAPPTADTTTASASARSQAACVSVKDPVPVPDSIDADSSTAALLARARASIAARMHATPLTITAPRLPSPPAVTSRPPRVLEGAQGIHAARLMAATVTQGPPLVIQSMGPGSGVDAGINGGAGLVGRASDQAAVLTRALEKFRAR